jgi:hypothetical protein
MESQMLLGSALDPGDPLTSMFMAGSEAMVPYYNFNPSASMSKQRNFHSSYDGMSATGTKRTRHVTRSVELYQSFIHFERLSSHASFQFQF